MFEVEIKSLLGSKERAEALKRRLSELFPAGTMLPLHKQLNHYFSEPSDLGSVVRAISPFLSPKKSKQLAELVENIRGNVSLRTREADGRVLFILKASIGDDSSANGVLRIEFEEPVELSLQELDAKLLDAGLSYQAKWSREREEYVAGDTHITIDKNAGYGYLAEFEKMVENQSDAESAKHALLALMKEADAEELPQDRLERMFAHYNTHWEEYYGTDKVFLVE